MNFTPNPQLFASVFVLPGAVADEYLPLASAAQLKVILAVFRTSSANFNIQEIMRLTGLPEQEVSDACRFWVSVGVLLCDGKGGATAEPAKVTESRGDAQTVPSDALAAQTSVQSEKEKSEPAPKAKEKITVSPTRPTHAQICKRLDECAELRELFNEAQTVLGRLLGTGDQAALLLLYDYYGLPADVILMLCEYARTRGKTGNLNYIYSVGQDWSEREIDTFERADEELRRLSAVDDNWTALCARTGMQHAKPTKGQQKYLSVWINEWHFSVEMIALAYEIMTERTDGIRFSYMNGILKSWYQKGIKTVAEVEAEEKQFREKTSATPVATAKTDRRAPRTDGVSAAVAKSGIADGPASYDLEKAELAARTSVPKLRKRKKK